MRRGYGRVKDRIGRSYDKIDGVTKHINTHTRHTHTDTYTHKHTGRSSRPSRPSKKRRSYLEISEAEKAR